MATVERELEIEPLVAGDRLTREEFLRRWEAIPELKKAELIGGGVAAARAVFLGSTGRCRSQVPALHRCHPRRRTC